MTRTAAADHRRPAQLTPAVLTHHVVNLLPMVLAHVGAVAVIFTGGTTTEWLLLPVLVWVRGAASVVGYHRYFAHRSFKTSRAMQFVMACCCCTNLQQGPLWWALHHRLHHNHADGPGDPHSPHRDGFIWAHFAWLFVPLAPDWRKVSDLRRYPELVWLERLWQLPGILTALAFYAIGGWSFLCIGFCLSAVIVFQLTFAINSVAHSIGTRRYENGDQSRNSLLLAIITMGEGWHNNHHHYPHAAQSGFFPGEVDGAFRVIVLLERLGLVWDVHRVPARKLDPASANPRGRTLTADDGTPKETPRGVATPLVLATPIEELAVAD